MVAVEVDIPLWEWDRDVVFSEERVDFEAQVGFDLPAVQC